MQQLNPEQRRVVEYGEGPLLVLAGPGSGKTRVITERIVHLLGNVPGIEPRNILALTFTDKAATEMKERVRRALGDAAELPHVSTFHSFCYEVLRKRHFERQLLDKVNVWIFLRRRMEKLGLEFYRKLAEPGAFLHDLNEFFSRCQDELIEPGDFERHVEKIESEFLAQARGLDHDERREREEEIRKQKELARVFRRSRELLEEAGCSSLGSLISETVRLWEREPDVLAEYRSRFRHVLVDEFQDTNYAQVELLRRMVAPPWNITAVGDDDQAIYRFRGASHGAFRMFADAFPAHQTAFLYRNYRSTRKVLRCANAVIARNTREISKPPLATEKGEGCAVFLAGAPDYPSEAAWIAQEVERLAQRGNALGEIAVLFRAHRHRDLLVEEFRRRGIRFSIRGLSVLSTVILRDLVAYLKLADSPHDNVALTRVLLMPRWKLPEGLALALREQAAKDRCSLFEALEGAERAFGLKDELAKTGWAELNRLLRELKRIALSASVTSLFDRLTEKLGLVFLPGEPDRVYTETFRKFLAEWEDKSSTRKLEEFLEYFDYFVEAGGKIEAPEPENPANAVQMMTVHAAKGLEFPVVFVMSVAPKRFPHFEQKPVIEFPEELRKGPQPPADIHLQEERRLFYVAITRARERLYISSVVKPGGKPSVFVEDLLSDPVVAGRDIERIEVPEIGPEERRASPPPPAAPGPPSRAEGEPRQQRLFGDSPAPGGCTHPNLSEWASEPPRAATGEKLRLSATAIEDYRSCPLKFKFGHCMKIPTGPQAALTFGNVMHQCVRRYFELRAAGLPGFGEIEEYFLKSWKSAGFEDDYQEQTYRQAGLEQLRQFVERQNASDAIAAGTEFERRFTLDLGDVSLEGRIDQISPLRGAGPARDQSIELIDYKTGRPKSQREADKSLQLSIYALAARRVLKRDPARLTFYNLTDNEAVSTVRTEKDLRDALEEVRDVAGKIRGGCFDATPGFVCKRCDFVPICPAHEDAL